jgi:hypothetical protein
LSSSGERPSLNPELQARIDEWVEKHLAEAPPLSQDRLEEIFIPQSSSGRG